MKAKPRVKKYIPDLRLARLAKQAGGKMRKEAVQDATARVEDLRDVNVDGIETALRQSEALLHHACDGFLTKDQLTDIRELSDRVVTLAGTYGYVRLFEVAASLCELTSRLLSDKSAPVGPFLVHVHAAWLFAPRAAAVSDENAQNVLDELGRVLEYFGIAPDAEVTAAND